MVSTGVPVARDQSPGPARREPGEPAERREERNLHPQVAEDRETKDSKGEGRGRDDLRKETIEEREQEDDQQDGRETVEALRVALDPGFAQCGTSG